ncbi:MAG: hypothetical protein C0497_15045 [Gemmatimonas sp.]|nr:hypothetical protein [Gemmatimonas sp.]
MWSTNWRRGGAALLLVAVVLVAWGAVGLRQGLNAGFTGGLYDPEYRVPDIHPGGVADRAGFKAGDRVISVEGIAVERLGMESRWPRSLAPRVGQSHRFIVERNGAQVPVDLVYPPPFAAAVNNRIAAFVQGHIATAASVLMYMLLLRFFVTYPSPKKVSESRLATWTSSRAQLQAFGINLIVVGFVVAILWSGATVFGVVRLPSWVTSLAIAAIPLTMALAVRRQARAEGQASRLH